MEVDVIEPPIPVVMGGQWTLSLRGEITSETPASVREIIASSDLPANTQIYLDSAGGNLLAGMELGRIIRGFGMWTNIGSPDLDDPLKVTSGDCMSACALAFLGGSFRFLHEGSRFGVHRFSSTKTSTADLEIAQVLSAAVVSYIREMGVRTELFDEMVAAPSSELLTLAGNRLRELGVVNDGILPVSWTLQTLEGHIYLRGEQVTWNGTNKIVFLCDDRRVLFSPFFQPVEDALDWEVGNDVILDGEHVPITEYKIRSTSKQGEFVSAVFLLTEELRKRVVAADRIGYALRIPNPDIYYGFEMDKGKDGHMVADYANDCARR